MKTKLLFTFLLISAMSFAQAPGDLIITEIMPDPSGTESENEWFEIQNTTDAPIDINGLSIVDSSSSNRWHLIDNTGGTNTGQSLVIPAGGYAVLAPTLDNTIFDGAITVTYAYGFSSQSPATSTTVGGSNFPRFNNTNSFDDGVSSNVTDGTSCNSSVDAEGVTDDETDGIGLATGTVADDNVVILDEFEYDYGYNNATFMSGATNPVGGVPDLTVLPGWDFGSAGLEGSSCFMGNADLDDNVTFQLVDGSFTFSDPSAGQVGLFFGTPGAANGNVLSVGEVSSLDRLTIFPNPAKTTITIKSADQTQVDSVELYNILGLRVLATSNLINDSINVSEMATGVYLLKVNSGNNSVTKRVVIE